MTLAWRLLALGLAASCLVAGGYRWGSTATANRIAAEQLQAERAATSKLLREIDRGNTATAQLGAELQAQDTSYRDLERAFNALRKSPVPLVVHRRGGGAVVAGPAAAAQAGAAPSHAASQAPGCVVVLPQDAALDAGPVLLTAAAVWVWNSSLTGRDTPAGACGAADTSEGACATETSIDLEAAIANHTENARLCAEDRSRHRALIDFLTTN